MGRRASACPVGAFFAGLEPNCVQIKNFMSEVSKKPPFPHSSSLLKRQTQTGKEACAYIQNWKCPDTQPQRDGGKDKMLIQLLAFVGGD